MKNHPLGRNKIGDYWLSTPYKVINKRNNVYDIQLADGTGCIKTVTRREILDTRELIDDNVDTVIDENADGSISQRGEEGKVENPKLRNLAQLPPFERFTASKGSKDQTFIFYPRYGQNDSQAKRPPGPNDLRAKRLMVERLPGHLRPKPFRPGTLRPRRLGPFFKQGHLGRLGPFYYHYVLFIHII